MADGRPSEGMTVVVDGAVQPDGAVPLVDDGQAHAVEISVPGGSPSTGNGVVPR
jgi:hypothetical protein